MALKCAGSQLLSDGRSPAGHFQLPLALPQRAQQLLVKALILLHAHSPVQRASKGAKPSGLVAGLISLARLSAASVHSPTALDLRSQRLGARSPKCPEPRPKRDPKPKEPEKPEKRVVHRELSLSSVHSRFRYQRTQPAKPRRQPQASRSCSLPQLNVLRHVVSPLRSGMQIPICNRSRLMSRRPHELALVDAATRCRLQHAGPQ